MRVVILEIQKFGDRHETIRRNAASVPQVQLQEVEDRTTSIDYPAVDLIIAHHTDVSLSFPRLVDDFANAGLSRDRALILHTIDWNSKEPSVESRACPANGQLTIIRCGSDLVEQNIATFLRDNLITRDGAWNMWSLLRRNSRRADAEELLGMFLPLDIDLQLGDLDGARQAADSLLKKQYQAAQLFSRVLGGQIDFATFILFAESQPIREELAARLGDLWKRAQTARTVQSVDELEAILGFVEADDPDDPRAAEAGASGFHRAYKDFRNDLFHSLDRE